MAKVTHEYVRRAFYRKFAELPQPKQEGIIEGLMAIMEARGNDAPAQMELPIQEEETAEEVA